MFDKFSRSWTLVKASAAVLRSDKELLVFPVLSGIAALLVVATFVVPMLALRVFESGMGVSAARSGASCSTCASTRDLLLQRGAGRRGDDPAGGRRSDRWPTASTRRKSRIGADPRLRGDRRHRRHAAAGAEEARTTTSWCACSAAAWAWPGRCPPSWWCRCWCSRTSARSTRSRRAWRCSSAPGARTRSATSASARCSA